MVKYIMMYGLNNDKSCGGEWGKFQSKIKEFNNNLIITS